MPFIWYSPSAAGLKVGRGLPGAADVVTFVDGFAELAEDDPMLDEKVANLLGAVGAYPGLRQVTAEDRKLLEAPLTFTDAEWDAMAARRAGARK
jgi:hypothetical protein